MATLKEAIQVLSLAAQADSPEFESAQYVEVRRNAHEIILGGNREGLVWLALHCLRLSEQQHGSHIHLDEHSGTDISDIPLVLRHWTREIPNQS